MTTKEKGKDCIKLQAPLESMAFSYIPRGLYSSRMKELWVDCRGGGAGGGEVGKCSKVRPSIFWLLLRLNSVV